VARDHLVFEGRRFGHGAGTHVKPHWPTLHVDDWVVSILARRRRGETHNILRLDLVVSKNWIWLRSCRLPSPLQRSWLLFWPNAPDL
jgi:hypothetical protein